MGHEKSVEVLNDVTAKLIDSCKGYNMCAEIADDNPALRGEFVRRENDRKNLVSEFQAEISRLGGEYTDSGTVGGALHRGYTQFVDIFKDDRNAALDALDTGEEHLADYIKSQQEEDGLGPDTILLLNKARASAIEGERFADLLDD